MKSTTYKAFAITTNLKEWNKDPDSVEIFEEPTLEDVVQEAAVILADQEVEVYEVTYKLLGKSKIVFPPAKLEKIKPTLKEG